MIENSCVFDKTGIFIRESKNRFLCEVKVNEQITECYIPSSCRIDNFLDLSNKEVLLSKNKSQNPRTQYRVVAVKHKRSYIIINTSISNLLVYDNLHLRRFSFLGPRKNALKEKMIGSYKADILIQNKFGNTIIEIKSIISPSHEAFFPTVYSQRAIDQLQQIKSLLSAGYNACYIFISLNPYTKTLQINPDIKEYHALLKECIQLGMVLKGYSCKFMNNKLSLTKEIAVSL